MKNVSIPLKLAKQIEPILYQMAIGKTGFDVHQDFAAAIDAAENPMISIDDFLPKMIRPIIFFDTETTGTEAGKDRIVSLDLFQLNPNGETFSKRWLINPTIPIPAGASEVHKIYDADVAGMPTFLQLAPEISNWFYGCDLAHFNGDKFDIPLLAEELDRAGIAFSMEGRISIDVSNIFRKKEGRSLSDALKFYIGEDHSGAHDSEADVKATFKTFLAQMKAYPDYFALSLEQLAKETCYNPNAVDLAGKFYRNEAGEICFSFGKHKDQLVRNNYTYCDWMLDKGDFQADTRRVIFEIHPALRTLEQSKLNL